MVSSVTRFFMKTITTIIAILLLSPWTHALELSDAEAFFRKYQDLGEAFDSEIASLYSDQAKIRMTRVSSTGESKSMTLSGAQLKAAFPQILAVAKASGDVSKYSEIKVSVDENRAVITANRFSVLHGYKDKNYRMVIEAGSDEKLLIVEEYVQVHR